MYYPAVRLASLSLSFALTLVLAARIAEAKPRKAAAKATDAPAAKTATACSDRSPGNTRWLDSDPHSPFFVLADGVIEGTDRSCCASWAKKGTRWRAVGRYGEVTGVATIAGGAGFDPAQCFELGLKMASGVPGVGILASEQGSWQPPARSAAWTPTTAEMTGLRRQLGVIEAMLDLSPGGGPPQPAFREPVLPFEIKADPQHNTKGGRFVAVGGRAFIVARLDDRGRWKVSHLETSLASSGGPGFTPLAAFDLDGDGAPELMFHWNNGESWGDTVMRFDFQGWTTEATSTGGSTS